MALTTVPSSLSATAITLTTAAQPNITSVGTLTGLTVSGNIAGTLTTAAQTNITSVGTLSSLTVSGQIKSQNDFVLADSGGTNRGFIFGTANGVFARFNSGLNFQVQEAGSTRFTIASGGNATFSGNVGVKVPSLLAFRTNSNEGAIQIGKRGVIFADTGITTHLGNNTYITSANQRVAIENDYGSFYEQYQGKHTFYTTTQAETANSLQTFITTLQILQNGNVGIGNSNPQRALQVGTYGTGNGEIAIASSTTGFGSILFGDSASGTALYDGYVQYQHDDRELLLAAGAVVGAKIDSNGDFGIGLLGGSSNPISARLDVVGGGTSAYPTLELVSNTSDGFNHAVNAFNASLTAGENSIIMIGKEGSTKNSGYIGYKWNGAGSDTNQLTFGHWAADNLMNLTANGNLGIGTETPSFSTINSVTSQITGLEIFKNGTDTAAALKLAGDNGSGTKAHAQVGYSGANGTAHFANFNTGGTQVGEIVIGPTGNVGIGEPAPDRTFHAKSGANSNDGVIRIESANNNIMDMGTDGTGHFINCVNTDPFRVKFAGTEKFRIESSGDVDLINGGNLKFAAGYGVSFINQADFATGETVKSSVLDDYEEGTFVPTIGGSTTQGSFAGSSANGGFYIKVGRMVQVWMNVSGTLSGAAGTMRVYGLPFTTASNIADHAKNAVYSTGSLQYWSGSNQDVMGPLNYPSTRYLYFHTYNGSSTGASPAVNNAFQNLHCCAVYYTS